MRPMKIPCDIDGFSTKTRVPVVEEFLACIVSLRSLGLRCEESSAKVRLCPVRYRCHVIYRKFPIMDGPASGHYSTIHFCLM
jgi:hypothetical protein